MPSERRSNVWSAPKSGGYTPKARGDRDKDAKEIPKPPKGRGAASGPATTGEERTK